MRCSTVLAEDSAPRKVDIEYLNNMLESIKSKCRVKKINDDQVVGLKQVSKSQLGLVIYNGKVAGIRGLKNEVMTYLGKTDLDTYKKDGVFIKYYGYDGSYPDHTNVAYNNRLQRICVGRVSLSSMLCL
jgi:hypothetical protein